jgi:hypothetical protein
MSQCTRLLSRRGRASVVNSMNLSSDWTISTRNMYTSSGWRLRRAPFFHNPNPVVTMQPQRIELGKGAAYVPARDYHVSTRVSVMRLPCDVEVACCMPYLQLETPDVCCRYKQTPCMCKTAHRHLLLKLPVWEHTRTMRRSPVRVLQPQTSDVFLQAEATAAALATAQKQAVK